MYVKIIIKILQILAVMMFDLFIKYVPLLLKRIYMATQEVKIKRGFIHIRIYDSTYSEALLTFKIDIIAFLVLFKFIVVIDLKRHPLKISIKAY